MWVLMCREHWELLASFSCLCLRLAPPGLCLLSESRLTFHLQAAPDGAVSQRLCGHLRESWAMLEGENC